MEEKAEPTKEDWVTIDEAVNITGLRASTLRQYISSRGGVRRRKVYAPRVYYSRKDIEELCNNQKSSGDNDNIRP